jgi:hypothetical protein
MTNPISDLDEVVLLAEVENTACGAYIIEYHAAIRRAFEDAERYREVLLALHREKVGMRPRDAKIHGYQGHGHAVPGRWDGDNGAYAGQPCAVCAAYEVAADLAMPAPKLHCSSGPETELNLGADARGDNGRG